MMYLEVKPAASKYFIVGHVMEIGVKYVPVSRSACIRKETNLVQLEMVEGVVAILSLSSLLLLSSSDNLLLSSSRYRDNVRGEFMLRLRGGVTWLLGNVTWLLSNVTWLLGNVAWLRGDVIVASMCSSYSVDLSTFWTFSVDTAISGILLRLVTMVT